MSTLTKSPVRVARHALAVGSLAVRRYAHRFSPRKYTRPRLFACLVLKTFLKVDYRGPAALRRFLKRRRVVKRVALDSTGFDLGHASRYYVRRRNGADKGWQTVAY